MQFEIIKIFFLTTISFGLAMALTPLLTYFLYRYKIGKEIRTPTEASLVSKLHAHKAGTPTMGGILIWGTVLILSLLFFYLPYLFPQNDAIVSLNFLTRSQTLLPLGALIASALVGLVDDYINARRINGKSGLTVAHRLILYTIVAAAGALWFYYKLGWDIFHVPFVADFSLGPWYILIFIFVIVATAHSVNLSDGLDGLAGGLLLASFAAYGAIAFTQGKFELAAFCGVIIGALLAFLWFNIVPARFFMGDTGAMGLGVTLGIIAMLTNQALLLPIIGFLFVIESLSVIIQFISKRLRGKKIFYATPIHHHLEVRGWPEAKIVMRFWIIAAVMAVIGLVIAMMDKLHGT